MPFKVINIAIVSDHTILRKSVAHFLAAREQLHIAAQFSTLEELLSHMFIVKQTLHVVIYDMPQTPGIINTLQSMKAAMSEAKLLVLVTNADMPLLSDLLDWGVYGFLSKTDGPDELVSAIEAIAGRKLFRNRLLTEVMYWSKEQVTDIKPAETSALLDSREKTLLQLLWEDKSNKEIASHLFLSESSVEKMKLEIREKLGIKTSLGLLKYVIVHRMK